jgi:hypothetical protein
MNQDLESRVALLEFYVTNLQRNLKYVDDNVGALNDAFNEKFGEVAPEPTGGYRKHRTKKYRNKKRGTKRR